MNEPARFDWPAGQRWRQRLLIAGSCGGALCAVASLWNVEQALRSYLFAYFSCLSIAVGSLALWLLHNLVGGPWGFWLRRYWEAASRTLPALALLFVPIALGSATIFPWATMHADELGAKAAYLNVPFFLVRAAVYFGVWIGMAFVLNRWSAEFDRSGDPAFVLRAQQLSGPGLVLCGLTVTFAAIDWVMSLEPEWSSTIFGALVASAFLLAALAFSIAMAAYVQSGEAELPWNDFGNLLLTFVMMWTYLAFSQFLLIWSGNLPEEIVWYLHRTEGGWQWIGLSLAVGYFVLPFGLLLWPGVKRSPAALRNVAMLIVGMGVVNNDWLIAPAFSPRELAVHWLDFAALVACGGLWSACFLREIQARPITPAHEPRVEGLEGRSYVLREHGPKVGS